MNTETINKIGELRKRVSGKNTGGYEKHDSILYKYLDINDFNVDKAESHFLKNMEWREKNIADWVGTWRNDILQQITRVEYLGVTKKGEPVFYYPIGTINFRKIVQLNLKDEFTNLNTWVLDKLTEVCLENEKRSGGEFLKAILIVDYHKHSLKQIASFGVIDMVKDICYLFDTRYPLTFRKVYATRAPKIFSIMFNIIKRAVAAKSIDPLVIFKENDPKMSSELAKNVGEELVPTELGGKYKLKYSEDDKSELEEDEMDDFVPIEIDAGQTLNVEFEVFEPQTVLNWSFKTEGYDIGFGLLLNGKKELIPKQRVNSHEEIVVGSFVCEKVGKYALIFDNSYSQMRSKTVNYIVTMTEPDEDEEEDE